MFRPGERPACAEAALIRNCEFMKQIFQLLSLVATSSTPGIASNISTAASMTPAWAQLNGELSSENYTKSVECIAWKGMDMKPSGFTEEQIIVDFAGAERRLMFAAKTGSAVQHSTSGRSYTAGSMCPMPSG